MRGDITDNLDAALKKVKRIAEAVRATCDAVSKVEALDDAAKAKALELVRVAVKGPLNDAVHVLFRKHVDEAACPMWPGQTNAVFQAVLQLAVLWVEREGYFAELMQILLLILNDDIQPPAHLLDAKELSDGEDAGAENNSQTNAEEGMDDIVPSLNLSLTANFYNWYGLPIVRNLSGVPHVFWESQNQTLYAKRGLSLESGAPLPLLPRTQSRQDAS